MPKLRDEPAPTTTTTTQPVAWRLFLTVVVAMVLALGAGCSDDTKKEVDEAAGSVQEDAEDAAGKAAARTVAEAFRADLKVNDIAERDGLRSVEALQDVADDLPGEPDISGIDDGDADGLDDDGKVGVKVEDQSVCLVLPESGEDTEITDEAC